MQPNKSYVAVINEMLDSAMLNSLHCAVIIVGVSSSVN